METVEQIIMTIGDRLCIWDAYALLVETLTGGRGRIINFHRVADDKAYPWMALDALTLREFEDRIRHIRSKGSVITLEQLADRISRKAPWPKGSIVVTFDDGHKDTYLNAYPILRAGNGPLSVHYFQRPSRPTVVDYIHQ